MANEIPEALEKGKKTATKASAKKTTTKKKNNSTPINIP